MAEVRWTPQASDDLEFITDVIAQDSIPYACLFASDVLAAVERLEHYPRMGRIVPEEDSPNVRELILGDYRIIYRTLDALVEILTVYHGKRLLDPETLG